MAMDTNGAIISSNFKYRNVTAVIPSTVDWRKKGAVTPTKDQCQCGSCWAFSAVAAIEGITTLTTGKLISLSEQELVDCDNEGHGCESGWMDNAFQFIKHHGLVLESKYKYTAVDGGKCKLKENDVVNATRISGYEDVPRNDEATLLKAVSRQPVSVAIDAGGIDFQFYQSGVFNGPCGTDLNHGVTVVGYGGIKDEDKYWLVKNSWGEMGYIKMKRGVPTKHGICGIAMMPSYPKTTK